MAIWVVCEGGDNGFRPATLELLSRARALSSEGVGALVLGGEAANAQALTGLADRVVTVPGAGEYDPDQWSAALAAFFGSEKPSLVLFGESTRTRELLPRLAVALSATPFTNCVGLDRVDGGLTVARPVQGGKAYGTFALPSPSVAAFRPNSFDRDAPPVAESGFEEFAAPAATSRVEVVERKPRGSGRVALTEARAVVSAGRGMKGPENLRYAEELADALGGAVGVSRAIVDAGWASHAIQVGKSGKTVSPALYFAVGISGAVHHTMGMDTSKVVVAINTDPKAPIFNYADYGIALDALEVLPALAAELKKALG